MPKLPAPRKVPRAADAAAPAGSPAAKPAAPKQPVRPKTPAKSRSGPAPAGVTTPTGRPAAGSVRTYSHSEIETSGRALDAAAALAALAAEQTPIPVSTAPFVSAAQREVSFLEARWANRVKIAKFTAAIVLALLAVHFAATEVIFREPHPEALVRHARTIAERVLPACTTPEQPFRIDTAEPRFRRRISGSHRDYVARVTLRLAEPLYGPATSNGAFSYRQLRESLDQALGQGEKLGFIGVSRLPTAPDMPILLQVLHPAGEPFEVEIPFEATRFGWSWSFSPLATIQLAATPNFSGLSLSRYAGVPHLVLGGPETLPPIRERMKAAREYIVAVAREVQRFSAASAVDDAAVAEKPAGEESPESKPAMPPIDPDAAAVPADGERDPASAKPVDPEAPATAPAAVVLPKNRPGR